MGVNLENPVLTGIFLALSNVVMVLINRYLAFSCQFRWPLALLALQATCLHVLLEIMFRFKKVEKAEKIAQDYLFTSSFYLVAFYGFSYITLQNAHLQSFEVSQFLAYPLMFTLFLINTKQKGKFMHTIYSIVIFAGVFLFLLSDHKTSVKSLSVAVLAAVAFGTHQYNIVMNLVKFEVSSIQYLNSMSQSAAWFSVIASFTVESWDEDTFWNHTYKFGEVVAIGVSCAVFIVMVYCSFVLLGKSLVARQFSFFAETAVLMFFGLFVASSGNTLFKLIGFLAAFVAAVLYTMSGLDEAISVKEASKGMKDQENLINSSYSEEGEIINEEPENVEDEQNVEKFENVEKSLVERKVKNKPSDE